MKAKLRKILVLILALVCIITTALFVACDELDDPNNGGGTPSTEQTGSGTGSGSGSGTGSGSGSENGGDEDDGFVIPEINIGGGGDTTVEYETEAPVITLFDNQYGMGDIDEGDATGGYNIDATNFGAVMILPDPTVIDDVDGDITQDVYVVSTSGTKFATVKKDEGTGKYTFQSFVGGKHEVIYFAQDSEGQPAYKSITINVQAQTAEEDLSTYGENDLQQLDNSGHVFTENFEDGPASPLVAGSYRSHVSLDGSQSKAISGNSLIIDYREMLGANGLYFLNLSEYFVTGIWEIEFDVKLIEGAGVEPFYFAYGTNSATYGGRYNLKGMSVGEIKHITFKQAIEVPEEEEGWWYFYIYHNNSNSYETAVLALDNFKISRTELTTPAHDPSIEELEEGFHIMRDKTDYYCKVIMEADHSMI